ncbi:glycosyltransferase [Mesonia sp. HuA40]|uniref:glycosyltransferase n=1 Tax=Mesonia sp. HuA40 TaxID=2602761 RepID=UPI0011CC5E59|nr:glycosyltransferase [Mesonia sp. HuA40]TXK71629.1 glycosyltransferase [Mesonia sp. HuA40]
MQKPKILVVVLNWGLGHASRCIPLITALEQQGFEPIMASDGLALALLTKNFPHLNSYRLQAYEVRYSRKPTFLKAVLALQVFSWIKNIYFDKKQILAIHKKEKLSGVISDNRPGAVLLGIPSVYLTHQTNILGAGQSIANALHWRLIRAHSHCWIPDFTHNLAFAGKLSQHTTSKKVKIKKIGLLSQLKADTPPVTKKHICILLSGPEPQRSQLEAILLQAVEFSEVPVVLIRGSDKELKLKKALSHLKIIDFATKTQVQHILERSHFVIARSGYSSLMDFCALGIKAFLIPTPGQPEQEYLASYFSKQGWATSCKQEAFTWRKLEALENIKGFPTFEAPDFKTLFSIFRA